MQKITLIAIAATLGLAACNNADLNRAAIGGAGVGAATAIAGGNVATGVAAGAAAGALCDDVVPELCPR
ncbi:hypothetical protein [Oceaniglobus indicus]|uniref:hypothetical protein n=1 Tax=Oceaniglobus indicus TaxID=2047749 RepID=UPI00147589F3|nr:hypothetical protein [Oceaniglobus indicus]